MKKIILLFILFTTFLHSREIGQTEISTEEGIEVYQKEKYYLLKKNVEIDYVSIVHLDDFLEVDREIRGRVLISIAVFVNSIRLIDNISYSVSSK